jgi:hypothetical protein
MVPVVGGHIPGLPLEVLELEDAAVELDEAAVVELDEAAVDELDELPPVQFPPEHVIEPPHTCPQ